jgi:hypothetical protein
MAPDSWSFSLSARHPFNLGNPCDPKTGPLGRLLDEHGRAFVTGYAYLADHPVPDAPYRQTPGELTLDPKTRAAYETIGCRPAYRMDFRYGGYYFSIRVAISERAGPSMEEEVLDVLNSITERRLACLSAVVCGRLEPAAVLIDHDGDLDDVARSEPHTRIATRGRRVPLLRLRLHARRRIARPLVRHELVAPGCHQRLQAPGPALIGVAIARDVEEPVEGDLPGARVAQPRV